MIPPHGVEARAQHLRVGGRARSARLRRRRSFGWRAGWPLRPPVLGASLGARPFSSSHARLWCAILSEEGPRPGGPTVEAVRASPQRPLTARDRGTPTGRQAPGACRSGATCGSRGRTSGPYSKVARPSGAQVISQTPRFRWPRLPVGSGGVHRPADLRRRGASGFDLLSLCARESPQVAFDAPLSVVSGRHRLGRVVGRRQGVEVGLELLVRVEDLAGGSSTRAPTGSPLAWSWGAPAAALAGLEHERCPVVDPEGLDRVRGDDERLALAEGGDDAALVHAGKRRIDREVELTRAWRL